MSKVKRKAKHPNIAPAAVLRARRPAAWLAPFAQTVARRIRLDNGREVFVDPPPG